MLKATPVPTIDGSAMVCSPTKRTPRSRPLRKGSRTLQAEKHYTRVHEVETSHNADGHSVVFRRPTRSERRQHADFERRLLRQVSAVMERYSLAEKMKHRSLMLRLPEMVSAYAEALHIVSGARKASTQAFQAAVTAFLKNRDHLLVGLIREFHHARNAELTIRRRPYKGAWFDHRGQLKTRRPTIAAMQEMRRFMSVDRPLPPARHVRIPKPQGRGQRRGAVRNSRDVFDFTTPTRALQRMVLDIVQRVLPVNKFDFSRRKAGGKDGAARAIRTAIEGGCRYFAVADVVRAFPSTKAGHVAELVPLPSKVIHNVICPDTTKRTRSSNKRVLSQAATARPLPQGAVTSAAILSALLGRELRRLAGANRVIVVIVDDIAIGAHTRGEAEQALNRLQSMFASLRAGPLHIGKFAIQSPYEGGNHVQFAGYRHRYFDDTKRLHCSPSDRSIERMKLELAGKLRAGPHNALERIREQYFAAWRSAFPEWTAIDLSLTSIENATRSVLLDVMDELIGKGIAVSLRPVRSRRVAEKGVNRSKSVNSGAGARAT